LKHILCHYGKTRADVYKRLFQVLWFGAKIEQSNGGLTPTYVFPHDFRDAIRKRFDDTPPSGHDEKYEVMGYKVSWVEMMQAKWPQPPKSCALCHQKERKY